MTYCREKHLTSQCFLTSHTKVKCTRDAIQQLCDVTVLLHQRSKGIQKKHYSQCVQVELISYEKNRP